jgi:hypothetical protein
MNTIYLYKHHFMPTQKIQLELGLFILLGLSSVYILFTKFSPVCERLRIKHLRVKLFSSVFCAWLVPASLLMGRFVHGHAFLGAVRSGNVDGVRKLLSADPTLIQARTIGVWENDTALHLAAARGDNDMVMLLLEHKADVNAKDEAGITPLHLAALHGQASVAKTLLGAGATVDAIGFKDNDTPLIVAADNGRLGVVEVLLAYGANTNAVDKFGTTALQCARNGHHTNVAALLSK